MTHAAPHVDPIEALRRRESEKWSAYPDDVLPLFVAEMDFALAPPIKTALARALQRDDTGYVNTRDTRTARAFAEFARDRWGWEPRVERMGYATDVSTVIVEALRRLIVPGEGVVITPPVYPPFFDFIPEAGGTVVEVPMLDDGETYRLDLDGIDRALDAGARAVLLCNPGNPTGTVHDRETLAGLSRVVARHGASVVSDEIHAPLVHPGTTFTPYLTVSEEARDHGIAAESASKAFNLAGLKTAMFVAESDRMAELLHELPEEVAVRAGIFGFIATREGFTHGREWLDAAVAAVVANAELLERQLAEHLPAVRYRRGAATYLAWLDLSGLDLGDDPAAWILEHAKVALVSGLDFGAPGAGYARLNLACAPETIVEAVRRIAAAVDEGEAA
ncbi:aminotransferase class I/II-fold pyridoxal phosphate-dependent enzyme [Microbacterium sp. BK668]|uniref:MalY/PatB family protein n=1 Tax=Microbacterium sp. BK668 TaxID=2512118 RepID=UPI0010F2174B|nr:aminotransferase class I/II-fold pyridoxal phosphate-dependent enzyme [Microbacterium sp. BK668]TDN92447.1 cystathionine beta-lyase [Microbacterium sp. BK668]